MATDRFTAEQLTAILARLPEAKRAELGWEFRSSQWCLYLDHRTGYVPVNEVHRNEHLAVLAVVLDHLEDRHIRIVRMGGKYRIATEGESHETMMRLHFDYFIGCGYESRFTAAAAAYLGESK